MEPSIIEQSESGSGWKHDIITCKSMLNRKEARLLGCCAVWGKIYCNLYFLQSYLKSSFNFLCRNLFRDRYYILVEYLEFKICLKEDWGEFQGLENLNSTARFSRFRHLILFNFILNCFNGHEDGDRGKWGYVSKPPMSTDL